MNQALFLVLRVLFAEFTPALAEVIGFAGNQPGSLPVMFESALTGKGAPGRWQVIEDRSAQEGLTVAQLSPDKTSYRFLLAIYRPAVLKNVEARVRFKAVSGSVDQAGGLAVRLQNADNYYIARANALENNVRFCRVREGQRQELAGANLKATRGEWHTLSLRAQGSRFIVVFDGEPVIDTRDITFAFPGRVALWTKADSITHFERLEITALADTGAQ